MRAAGRPLSAPTSRPPAARRAAEDLLGAPVGVLPARDVFVSTMGVVYGIGEDVDEESVGQRQRTKQEAHADGRPIYTPLVGLSLMVFFAIACQCMSTLAVVKRQTRSWMWPMFLFIYTGALAWLLSFAVFQGGVLLGLG